MRDKAERSPQGDGQGQPMLVSPPEGKFSQNEPWFHADIDRQINRNWWHDEQRSTY